MVWNRYTYTHAKKCHSRPKGIPCCWDKKFTIIFVSENFFKPRHCKDDCVDGFNSNEFRIETWWWLVIQEPHSQTSNPQSAELRQVPRLKRTTLGFSFADCHADRLCIFTAMLRVLGSCVSCELGCFVHWARNSPMVESGEWCSFGLEKSWVLDWCLWGLRDMEIGDFVGMEGDRNLSESWSSSNVFVLRANLDTRMRGTWCDRIIGIVECLIIVV